jgi:hypothetical protein
MFQIFVLLAGVFYASTDEFGSQEAFVIEIILLTLFACLCSGTFLVPFFYALILVFRRRTENQVTDAEVIKIID